MDDEQVQQLGIALQLIKKSQAVLEKIQLEISSELLKKKGKKAGC